MSSSQLKSVSQQNDAQNIIKSVPFWSMNQEGTFLALQSSASGISEDEARRRLLVYGPNVITKKRRLTKTRILWSQLSSPLIILLLIADVLMLALREWTDAGIIIAAVAINTVFGFWQEYKAETVLSSLKNYLRTFARVRRDDAEREVAAESIVPGDIIRLSQGDRVPADARIIYANRLEIDESILTGESLPVEKNATGVPEHLPLAERASMAWGGTLVVEGYADVVVTATGSQSEFGRIALLTEQKPPEPTPLQRAISRFSLWSGGILGLMASLLFLSGLLAGYGTKDMFLLAVAVSVSAVPEGLPIALTVILAIGVERIARRKGIVRRLLAAETLGSTSVILTDKTGTLTQARMELTDVLPFHGTGPDQIQKLLSSALLNTDVIIENPEEPANAWRMVGRPIEVALVREAGKRGLVAREKPAATAAGNRLPFSSVRKYSETQIRRDDGSTVAIRLGAPDILLRQTDLPAVAMKDWLRRIDRLARSGSRILGLTENNAFLGLLVFRDPLRPTVKNAIQRMQSSGVRTVIVTGDHPGTTEYVARELGLLEGQRSVLTGMEFESLTAKQKISQLRKTAAFARMSPEQKAQIVELFRAQGEIVAVTGDGVNDGPALQAADIGVAVGSGTEVAKGAADLVLLDNNFETIVAAIEEGRKILQNIRKVIVYLLSDSLDELFLIGGSLLLGIPLPINALQILFVNFFSDSLPALAFAFESGADDHRGLMRQSRQILDRPMKFYIFFIGVLSSAFLLALYVLLRKIPAAPQTTVQTFIFASFASYTLFIAFPLRSLQKNIWRYRPFSNPFLNWSVLIGIFLTLAAIYVPAFQRILRTVPLPPAWLAAVLGAAILNVAILEIGKWFLRPFHGMRRS